MSKERASKLDQYAAELEELFQGGKTLLEAQTLLATKGCTVSLGGLSNWWSRRQEEILQEKMLERITTGAATCKAVEAEFGKNPAPEVETIIKLQRVLIMQLTTQANVDPSMIKLVAQLTKPSMEYAKLQEKRREIEINERKLRLLEDNAAQAKAKLTEMVSAGGLSGETLAKAEAALKLL
jgi:hypothetical protein